MQGDILFYTASSSFTDRLICWWTHSRFCHVGIDIGQGETVEAVGQGIIQRPIAAYTPSVVWSLEQHSTDYDPTDLAVALVWLKGMVGKPYGYGDDATAVLRRLLSQFYIVQLQHFNCSALTTEFLSKVGGIDLANLALDPHLATPASLAKQLGVK